MENANSELVELLSAEDSDMRMLALHWLSEGYVSRPDIVARVFDAWDNFGIAEAFPEFPMLSYLPIGEDQVEACGERAERMLANRKLTDIETRCAGKLIEQVGKLPAVVLQPHMELLRSIVAKSKIFFRVDLPAIEDRIGLLGMEADALASRLDESITALGIDLNDATAVHRGLHALEALRRQHPDYMNLAGVLAASPPSDGPQAFSFQLTLQSLLQLEQSGLETHLAKHLHDARESVFIPVAEVLVRMATAAAAEALIQAYPSAPSVNHQHWIARGLQRIRVKGLADRIASLRAATQDPNLALMLMIAEIRQIPQSSQRIATDIEYFSAHSYELINTLLVYTRMAGAEHFEVVQPAFAEYLKRADAVLRRQLQEKQKKLHTLERRNREKARQRTLNRHREGQG